MGINLTCGGLIVKCCAVWLWGMVLAGLLVACGNSAAADTHNPVAELAVNGDPIAGEQAFINTCSSCHGFDARGIPGLGKDVTTSPFFLGMDEATFIEFIHAGRPASDPANTTGVDMPPRGGNPALTDEDIVNIRAFIYSLP